MNYETIIDEFIICFPELELESRKELSEEWHKEERIPHVFFGYVLNPFLVKELATMENKVILKRIFQFLESMAISEDEEVKGVLSATVLEYLGDNKDTLNKARDLMEKETLKLSHEVERSWGRE